MKIFIKNKMVSLRGNSFAQNEFGENIYNIKGKVFSLTNKKKIYDMNDNLLYVVKNKLWNFWNKRAYILSADNEKIAVVKYQPLNFKVPYILEGYKDEIALTGNFASRQLKVQKGETVLGTITRDLNFAIDSFTLEAEEKDLPFLTAVVIAIDNIIDKQNNEA